MLDFNPRRIMINYLIQTLNSMYGLTIENGEYMLGKIMRLNESPNIEIGEIFREDQIVINDQGIMTIYKKGVWQFKTSPILNMNIMPNK